LTFEFVKVRCISSANSGGIRLRILISGAGYVLTIDISRIRFLQVLFAGSHLQLMHMHYLHVHGSVGSSLSALWCF
jgi:hypothetical protein